MLIRFPSPWNCLCSMKITDRPAFFFPSFTRALASYSFDFGQPPSPHLLKSDGPPSLRIYRTPRSIDPRSLGSPCFIPNPRSSLLSSNPRAKVSRSRHGRDELLPFPIRLKHVPSLFAPSPQRGGLVSSSPDSLLCSPVWRFSFFLFPFLKIVLCRRRTNVSCNWSPHPSVF